MTMLRLTQKAAKDFKIEALEKPVLALSVFDDWAVDVLRVSRKKIAMATHVKTKLTFFIPYMASKGLKPLIKQIELHFLEFVKNEGLFFPSEQLINIFSSKPTYYKTDNRSLMGHMKDFKWFLEGEAYLFDYDEIDWASVNMRINERIMNVNHSRNCNCPRELMLELIHSNKAP